jgi:hypothetical protein
MDFDDLFKGERHGHRKQYGYDRQDGHQERHGEDDRLWREGRGGHDRHAMPTELLNKLMANKGLLVVLGLAALLIAALAAWVAVTLIGAVSRDGIKGVLDGFDVPGILRRIWEGTGGAK